MAVPAGVAQGVRDRGLADPLRARRVEVVVLAAPQQAAHQQGDLLLLDVPGRGHDAREVLRNQVEQPVETVLVVLPAVGSRVPQVPPADQGGEPSAGFPFRVYLVA